jgi:hypothetical protein
MNLMLRLLAIQFDIPWQSTCRCTAACSAWCILVLPCAICLWYRLFGLLEFHTRSFGGLLVCQPQVRSPGLPTSARQLPCIGSVLQQTKQCVHCMFALCCDFRCCTCLCAVSLLHPFLAITCMPVHAQTELESTLGRVHSISIPERVRRLTFECQRATRGYTSVHCCAHCHPQRKAGRPQGPSSVSSL